MTPPVIKPLADSSGSLVVAVPPHARLGMGIRGLSVNMLVALLPALAAAVAVYGLDAARVVGLAGAVAVLAEAACQKLMKRDVDVDNYSALYAGVVFACLLPAAAPWWLVVIGALLTVVVGRAVFGGFGSTPLCAPLIAWAMCSLSWPSVMDIDASMTASVLSEPLALLKFFGVDAVMYEYSLTDLFMGKGLGALGASQVGLLLTGGIFLLVRRVIRWYIPIAFLAGVAASAYAFQLSAPDLYAGPLFHLCTGSVMLGAFFLATDTAASPVGRTPMLMYGLIAGVLVMVIRVWGVYPDGVPFAILLANLLSPLLDKVRPKPFGA